MAKRSIGVIVGLVLTLFTGCGNKGKETAPAQEKAEPKKEAPAQEKAEPAPAPERKEVELGSGEIGQSVSFDLPGGEKLVMKYCPGGKFTMGSPAGEDGRSNGAQVEVTLSSHYWMAETECTQAQWEALTGDNPSKFKGERLPVEQVSWDDAQAYVSKLNEKVTPPAGWRWSLPTEAQWEHACRAGTTTAFSFGDDDKELTKYAWYQINSNRRTHPVGTKKPNPWGLHDMHGNVWEWGTDSWDFEAPRGGTDPLGTTGPFRVDRGGGFGSAPDRCRSAYRGVYPPATLDRTLGFRPAVVPSRQSADER